MITTTTTPTPVFSLARGRRVCGLLTLLALAAPLAACDAGDDLDDLDDAEALAFDVGAPPRIAAAPAEIPTEALSEEELALMAPTPAPAANHSNVVYECDIDVLNATTNCNPVLVDANEHDPGEWTATAHMQIKSTKYRRMDVFAEICDPSEYALSLADSPSANGWGGDSGQTDHDAEMHFYGAGAHFFSTTDYAHGVFANHSSLGGAFVGDGDGCQVVHTVTYQELGSEVGVLSIDGGGSPLTIRDDRGFQLDTAACGGGAADPARGISCDHEDAGLAHDNTWHVGLNRTVGSGSRDGSGVERACVVLSTDPGVAPESCLDPEPVSAEPEGTWKFCIAAGTPAEMEADCEAGGHGWAGLFGDNTYTTQDYLNMWGNNCPQGTSLVPNSQYYVANSCNPLPNVGAGCGGPGSFNYEYKVGVLCQ